ncbi:Small subunit (SSU) processome component [Onygenales sp. PD_10]|nr:Small subunit (SSU) processome component [Onygenales sp. PD_10]
MGTKKGSRGPVSKVSSAAAPSASPSTTSLSANKSSVLRSAFSPSQYQLALFASVIQGLDAQHLRVHDVGSARLQCEHAVNPRESITSLDWGYYGDRDRDQHMKKKRKRSSGVNGVVEGGEGEVVVAFGTSSSEIRMYSPAEDKIVGTLAGGHEKGIRDFRFTVKNEAKEGWSIGGDGKLVQWDLKAGRSIRVISLPSASISALAQPVPSNPPVLCASQTPYIIGLEQEGLEGAISFSAMRNSVHTLIPSSLDLGNISEQFLAADSDRYINIFDIQKKKLLGSLVADNEVESLAFYSAPVQKGQANSRLNQLQNQLLAVVTKSGVIELFTKPFHQPTDLSAATSLKSLRKTMTRRAEASIKIIRPDKSRTVVPIVSVSFQGSDLVVAWVEGGVNLVFERIRWQDEETQELVLQGEKEIVRGKSASMLGSAMVNGVKNIGRTQVDESHTVVEQGGAAAAEIEVDGKQNDAASAASDSDEELSDEEGEEQPSKPKSTAEDKDIDMADASQDENQSEAEEEEEEEEGAEPSFGDLLRARAASPIDVEAELDTTPTTLAISHHTPSTPPTTKKPSASSSTTTALQNPLPPGLSLTTVLTQSLKTNDTTLLESCLHTTDLAIVRTTIQRMDSSLAATLLTKLAERLSTRPGRYGHLLVWVQWTCIAHGGAIAGQKEVLKRIQGLWRVMEGRSACLGGLLLLKGKLDMIDAQLGLRRELRGGRGVGGAGGESGDEEGEDVIYVEGLEEEEEELRRLEEAEAAAGVVPVVKKRAAIVGEEESDEDMPLAINGVSDDDEEEEGSDEEDVELFDDEAEESEDDEGLGGGDEEEDEDEEDEEEYEGSIADFIADSQDEEEDEEAMSVDLTPAKISKRKGGSKVRR